jgi:2-polyprenyl-3-methyl-5-hydroxy-6-metoxy-1,4-benzoquinol methylase
LQTSSVKESVSEKEIYKKFFYEISVTTGLKDHYFKFEKFFSKKFKINKKTKKIIDIGCNDGSFLEPFKINGYNVLGVEPVKKFKKICEKKNINFLNNYFNKNLAKKFKKKNLKFDIIAVNFLLANVNYLKEFIESINLISEKKSYLIIETSHVLSVMKKNLYDTFFHEHIFYFSLYNLQNIFKKYKFEIHNLEFTKSKGGSLRIIFRKNVKCNSSIVKNTIKKTINLEKKYLFNNSVYLNFEKNLENTKHQIHKLLKNYKEKVVIFGASVATTTIIKKFNLENKIAYFIDDNVIMHGKHSPINKKPVFSPSFFFNDNHNKILLIVAIRYTDMIINKYKKFLKKKKIVRIYPKVELVKFHDNLKKVSSNELL